MMVTSLKGDRENRLKRAASEAEVVDAVCSVLSGGSEAELKATSGAEVALAAVEVTGLVAAAVEATDGAGLVAAAFSPR